MRIIAQYQDVQLQVATEFRHIVIQESLAKRNTDQKTINLNLFEGLKWRKLKKTIESIEIQKRTGRWSEMSDTDSWTDRNERIQNDRDVGIHCPDRKYNSDGDDILMPTRGSGPNKWLIVLLILAVAGLSALIWKSSASKTQTDNEINSLSDRSISDREKNISEAIMQAPR